MMAYFKPDIDLNMICIRQFCVVIAVTCIGKNPPARVDAMALALWNRASLSGQMNPFARMMHWPTGTWLEVNWRLCCVFALWFIGINRQTGR